MKEKECARKMKFERMGLSRGNNVGTSLNDSREPTWSKYAIRRVIK